MKFVSSGSLGPKMGFGKVSCGNSKLVRPKPLNKWFKSDFLSNHSTFISSIVNYILIFQCHLDFITTNFVLFFNHCRYFHFVFFLRGAIYEIPRLLEIWRNPKIDSTMYRMDMLRDWTSTHLLNYA